SLSSMFGIDANKVTQSIKTTDIKEGLSALAGTDGKIDIGQAIIYARNNKLSDAELAGYLGVTPETISNYITNRQIIAKLDTASGEDKKLSYSEILNFAEANNLSLEKVAEYITGPEGRAELVKNINEYKLDNQLRTGYEDAATLLQNAVRTFGSGSPQVDAAYDNLLNAKKAYLTSPNVSALRKAYTDAYQEYTGLSSEVGDREFDRNYNPGMTLQQLWDITVTPRQQTVTTPPASGAASTVNQQTSTTIKTEAPSTGVRYDDPIYISAFASGTLKRTDISDQEKASILNSFADDNNISRESLARATGYSLNDINTFLGHTPKSIAADLRNISDKDGSITYDKILEYSATKNIPLENIASAINTSADVLTKYKTDK
ncbi:MAG: hypothetical protein EBR82_84950, partial [Caulobacteraceae bacterium]|nr:hypothetical protein [Caulobacteraceae bacterium]